MSHRISSTLVALTLAAGGTFALAAPAEAAPAWKCSWQWNGSHFSGGKSCIRVNGANFEAYAEITSVPSGCRSISLYLFESAPDPQRTYTNFSCKKGKTRTIKASTANHKRSYHYAQVQIHTGSVTGPIRRDSPRVEAR